MKQKHPHGCNRENMAAGLLISHVSRIHLAMIHNSLESYGVQRTYGPILKELSMSEGMTQKELAAEMRITAPSMSVNLQKMENAGFLIRKTDDSDMRQIRVYLTDKGRETAEKADREIVLSEEKLVEALTSDEKKELKRLLVKILDSKTGRGE